MGPCQTLQAHTLGTWIGILFEFEKPENHMTNPTRKAPDGPTGFLPTSPDPESQVAEHGANRIHWDMCPPVQIHLPYEWGWLDIVALLPIAGK